MMRCRKCGERAVINMRQHKLALCAPHFVDWVPDQVEHTIKHYQMFTHHDRLLIAISGGKDSLSLWDILNRIGYAADGLYIGLGIDAGVKYSEISREYAIAFANKNHLHLQVKDVKAEYGESVAELVTRAHRGHNKPCSVCGLTKRHIMNLVAQDGQYNVLLTGHNLDDEAAILFGNTLSWIGSYLVHQGPVLEADRPGLIRKVKPLFRMYEREMAAYALLRPIPYIQDECPFAEGSTSIYHKQLLNKLEADRPGAKLNFYLSFLHAKSKGLFSSLADERSDLVHNCQVCGQPTSAPGMCAFCRMFVKHDDSLELSEANEI